MWETGVLVSCWWGRRMLHLLGEQRESSAITGAGRTNSNAAAATSWLAPSSSEEGLFPPRFYRGGNGGRDTKINGLWETGTGGKAAVLSSDSVTRKLYNANQMWQFLSPGDALGAVRKKLWPGVLCFFQNTISCSFPHWVSYSKHSQNDLNWMWLLIPLKPWKN